MNNKYAKYAGYIITFIALVFIGRSFMSMNLDVKYIKSPYIAIVLAVILSIGYAAIVYISSYAWKTTLEFIHKGKIPFHEIIIVYAKSNIGKYLPGNIMQFVGRNILASKLGFKQLDITFCTLIEIIMLVLTDSILSLIFALNSVKLVLKDLFTKINPSNAFYLLIALIILISIAVWVIVKKSGIIKEYKQFFTKDFLKLLCKLFCIYSVTLIIPGIFLVLIFSSVLGAHVTLQTSMIIIAGYTISWVLGFVVPGAPGGIGVREAILLLMLGPLFTNNIVLLAAILLRITSIIGDLIAFLLSSHTFVSES
jgi:glycosyltransferase 2 family protein